MLSKVNFLKFPLLFQVTITWLALANFILKLGELLKVFQLLFMPFLTDFVYGQLYIPHSPL